MNVRKKIKEIEKMGSNELSSFFEILETSSLEDKTKLKQAATQREKELLGTVDVMVVDSEMDSDYE